MMPSANAEVLIKSGSKLKAAPGYVVVEPKKPMTESPGGITLPAIAQEKTCEGTVIHHNPSPRMIDANDKLRQEGVEYLPGEFVIWQRYAGTEYKLGDVAYKILAETEIIATVEQGK